MACGPLVAGVGRVKMQRVNEERKGGRRRPKKKKGMKNGKANFYDRGEVISLFGTTRNTVV